MSKLLLVMRQDSNEMIYQMERENYIKRFEKTGREIHVVTKKREVIEQFLKEQYDIIVFATIRLSSDKEDYETGIRLVKDLSVKTKVLVLTGGELEVIRRIRDLGVKVFLKPNGFNLLLKAIEEIDHNVPYDTIKDMSDEQPMTYMEMEQSLTALIDHPEVTEKERGLVSLVKDYLSKIVGSHERK